MIFYSLYARCAEESSELSLPRRLLALQSRTPSRERSRWVHAVLGAQGRGVTGLETELSPSDEMCTPILLQSPAALGGSLGPSLQKRTEEGREPRAWGAVRCQPSWCGCC